MKRKQFTFYRSFYESIMKLPKKSRLELLVAIMEYGLDKAPPKNLSKIQEAQFLLIKPVLDTSWSRAKGGMASGKNATSVTTDCCKEKEKEKEKENEIEIETETESEGEGEGFARFWERYPLKLGQAQALCQWECVCEEFGEREILDGLERWRRSEFWKRENGRFIPKAEKWLSERWWLQEPKQAIVYGASGQLGKAEMEAIQELFER